MKLPISILCISDLHFEGGDMSAIKQLCTDYQEFVNSNEIENKRWHPDYVVVAGDIVNYDLHDYSQPQETINALISSFKIDPSHVIVVPGNHDKKIPKNENIRILDKNKRVFLNYCADPDNDSKKKEFGKAFYPRFKKYIKFCEPYFVEKKDIKYKYLSPKMLDRRLKYLSGLKVFEEDRLCFLIINTEWLYVSPKYFGNSIEKKVERHLKIYEKCKLCAPLVKDLCDIIKKEYPDYTVITVMHRGVEDLSWEENNVTDALTVDAVSYIQDISDVIFTGHDHTIHKASPTLVKNRIQHFKLGSVGRKELSGSEHIRRASIIRFYSAGNEIEMLHLRYSKISESKYKWEFKLDDSIYPLFSKYRSNQAVKNRNKQYDYLTIRAKSLGQDDIQKAIESHFSINDGIKMHYLKADSSTLKQELEQLLEKGDDVDAQYVIVYFIHHLVFVNPKTADTFIKDVENIIFEFKESHFDLFALNKFTINKIIIQIPIFEHID